MGESILGVLKSLKLGLCSLTVAGIDFSVKLPLWKSLEHCFCSVPEYICRFTVAGVDVSNELLLLKSLEDCFFSVPDIPVVLLLLALMSPINCSC